MVLSEPLIQFGWDVDERGLLKKIVFASERDNPKLAIPIRFIEIVTDKYLKMSFNYVLPESSVSCKVLPTQTLYHFLRGFLFVHKTFGIIQNPFETLEYEDKTLIPALEKVLKIRYEADFWLYMMMEDMMEWGDPLFSLMKQYGYSLPQDPTALDIFEMSFAEEVEHSFRRISEGKWGQGKEANKAKSVAIMKDWSAFMKGRKNKINVPNTKAEIVDYLQAKNTKREDREIKLNGLQGIVRIFAKRLVEQQEASEAMQKAFRLHLKSERDFFTTWIKYRRILEKDGKVYKVGPHNKHIVDRD
jgi:hypothetical protein